MEILSRYTDEFLEITINSKTLGFKSTEIQTRGDLVSLNTDPLAGANGLDGGIFYGI